MAEVIIAEAGTTETALLRVGGNGTIVGDYATIANSLVMEVTTQVGGRCIARFARPNAISGQTELTVQLDADPGEISRVRIPLGTIIVSTDPSSQNYITVDLAWVSYERNIQDAVVAERIRRALTYTRNRLLDFPSAERGDVATWETIANELAAQVSQKVIGGTIEVP